MTQKEMILKHLRRYGKITDVQAFDHYAIRRTSARIHDLREDGHDIKTIMTTKPNRFGQKTTFATYYLEGKK